MNTTAFSITEISGGYSLAGYVATKDYKVAIAVIGSANASINITDTTNLSFDAGFSSWNDVQLLNFIGKPSDIEAALNSIKVNTTNVVNGEIQLRVFITPQVSKHFLQCHEWAYI